MAITKIMAEKSSSRKDTVLSVSTEDTPTETHWTTSSHGFTAWGRTHTGGGSSDNNFILQDVSLPGSRHQSPVIGHQAVDFTMHQTINFTRHQAPDIGFWVPDTGHQALDSRH